MTALTETKLKLARKNGDTYPSTRDITGHPTTRNTVENIPITTSYSAHRPGVLNVADSLRKESLDVAIITETLENAAEEIIRTTHDLFTESIPERISEWLDLHGLDRSAVDMHEFLSRQAALQLLLKTTLYEHYHRRGALPALTDDILKALRHARRHTEDPAFDETVLDEIAWQTDTDIAADIAAHRHQLLASTQPSEDIGQLYEALLTNQSRRPLGQFRTPPHVAELMRSWAVREDDTVLEPGLGSATLSSPFHPDWRLSTDPTCAVGIDRSPLSRLMGSTALTLAGQSKEMLSADFLTLSPEDLPDADAMVCNPPYTRSAALNHEDKRRYREQVRRETGHDPSANSPLYAYFLYRCNRFLDVGDRTAVITPQAFLAAKYGRTLKRFLVEEFDIKAVVSLEPDSDSVFDTAVTTGLITFLEAADDADTESPTRFVRIDNLSAFEDADGRFDWRPVRDAIDRGEGESVDWGFINQVEQTELDPEKNWQTLFDPVDIDTDELPVLGDFVTVSRGPNTGDVGFFCLSNPEANHLGLDETHLSRILRRPSDVNGYDYREEDWTHAKENGKEVWLLDPDKLRDVPNSIDNLPDEASNSEGSQTVLAADCETDSNVVEYLRTGLREHGLADRTTLRNRPYWYRPRRKEATRVLVQNAGRSGFKFALNETEVRNTSAAYGFYDIDLTDHELKALLAYLNSSTFDEVVRAYRNARADGFDKIEPNELERVPVIDPTELNHDHLTDLAAAFDELRKTAREEGNCDRILTQIETIFPKVV